MNKSFYDFKLTAIKNNDNGYNMIFYTLKDNYIILQGAIFTHLEMILIGMISTKKTA